METKQFKIYDTVKTVEEERKSEHKDWFDSWNDRYSESFKESVKPIIDTLQEIGCDEKQTGDVFEYSCEDVNGVPHVVFRVSAKNFALEYPFISELGPSKEDTKAFNVGEFPAYFENPLSCFIQAYVYLVNSILNDHRQRADSLAKCIYFYCAHITKGKSNQTFLTIKNKQ
jgi:hypothetical protein